MHVFLMSRSKRLFFVILVEQSTFICTNPEMFQLLFAHMCNNVNFSHLVFKVTVRKVI